MESALGMTPRGLIRFAKAQISAADPLCGASVSVSARWNLLLYRVIIQTNVIESYRKGARARARL